MKITDVIEALQADNYYGISETVDIAKGKYQYTINIKKRIKRQYRKWQKK